MVWLKLQKLCFAIFLAIFLQYNFLLSQAQTLFEKEHEDLLVHFDTYFPRDQIMNSISSLLDQESISYSIPDRSNLPQARSTDFTKVQVPVVSLEKAKHVLQRLPNFRAFSLDTKIEATVKDLPSKEKMNPYSYKFLVNLTEELRLQDYWNRGHKGQGVKVAIFDTGVSDTYEKANKKNVKGIINLSNEVYANGADFSGHGTFVSSIITNSNAKCPGIAPDAELFIFKVFTKTEETTYSWFLEAFNRCIEEKVDLISFSIGSTNLMETPFVEKIKEVTAKGITIIAAAGNDGPFFGTINHPADLHEVLAVGGIDSDGSSIAGYSSRGMTTSEIATGMGRIKPDIVTLSRFIISSDIDGQCDVKSGTSFAVPVITGSLALILSSLSDRDRQNINPAMIRQALTETARRLEDVSMFEQGAGLFDIRSAFDYFHDFLRKKVSIFPSILDLTEAEPYAYPYSLQPLYYTGMPTILNLTVQNSLSIKSKVSRIEWNSKSTLRDFVKVTYSAAPEIYPYFGHIALILKVNPQASSLNLRSVAELRGVVKVYFEVGNDQRTAEVELTLQFINTPPREKRILWDQFHNMKFPENGFIPRDSLQNWAYPYEWHGDHPYINFFQLFNLIKKQGYYLEILRGSFECFDATKYGILLIVDPEDRYTEGEKRKLEQDVMIHGLSVMLFAEWYDPQLLSLNTFEPKASIYQPESKIPSTPVTGGSNIPALNTLLENFGVAFGTSSYAGDYSYGNRTHSYLSGSYIIRFPKNGILLTFNLFNESNLIINRKASMKQYEPKPILGLLRNIYDHPTSGKLIVYGDSNCIDSAFLVNDCFDLFKDMLKFVESGTMGVLDHFKNYEIPQDYIAKEEVVYYDESLQPLMKDYSKHNNPASWNRSLTCENFRFANRFVNFQEIKILAQSSRNRSSTGPITDWVSEQKDRKYDYLRVSDYMEHIQMVLMTCAVFLILFIVFLIRRRRRRFRYSTMERAKGQIIIV